MKICEMITEQVIKAIESDGVLPWQKPWNKPKGSPINLASIFKAYSYTSRKPYTLINQWFLKEGEYLTFNEINKLKGRIKKGAKSYVVYGFFVQYKDKDGNYNRVRQSEDDKVTISTRYYKVFHIEDTEGIKPHTYDKPTEIPTETEDIANDPIEVAEKVIADYVSRCKLASYHNIASDRAYYSPSQDIVVVPSLTQYPHKEEYYSTAFHELTHSSGHANRLNRKGITNTKGFGSHEYSKEELVAEMGSAFIMNALGISTEHCFNNSVAYIDNWKKHLKADTSMIVWASVAAEKAAKLILNVKN